MSEQAGRSSARARIALVIALLASACDLENPTEERSAPEQLSADPNARPIIFARPAERPALQRGGLEPLASRGDGAGPFVIAGTGAARTAAMRSAVSLSAAAAAGAVSHILWQNTSDGNRGFWPMTGTVYGGGWDALGTVPVAWDIAGMADFDNNGKPDIVWQNTSTGMRGVWSMDGTTFTGVWHEIGNVPVAWDIAAVADFNADGKPDILWQNTSTGTRGIWTMNGIASTGWYPFGDVPVEWQIAGAHDFTGDGKPDIVWQNMSTGVRGIWPLNGVAYEGGWHSPGAVPTQWRIAAVGDFTSDGRPDWLWQNTSTGQRGIWPMNNANYAGGWNDLGTVPTQWSVAAVRESAGTAYAHFGSITTGRYHSCGLSQSGAAFCWGRNDYGGFGDGTQTNSMTPVAVAGGHTFIQISAGSTHTCALKSNGTVWCWGPDAFGQLGQGAGLSMSKTPLQVTGSVRFVQIDAGHFHNCGISFAGDVYCWGYGGYGEMGNGANTATNYSPVKASSAHKFISVSANYFSTCAVTTRRSAYCWGWNGNGQLGNASLTAGNSYNAPQLVDGSLSWSGVLSGYAYSDGYYRICGTNTAGAAYCWGSNFYGQAGTGAGAGPLTSPALVSGGITWRSVSGGGAHSCGVSTGNAAYCWGYNWGGQIGDASTATRNTPAAVAGGIAWGMVEASGQDHTCGVSLTGEAFCWGLNFSNVELGNVGPHMCGSYNCAQTPTRVSQGAASASAVTGVVSLSRLYALPDTVRLVAGDTARASLAGFDAFGNRLQPSATYTSINSSVATVDATGKITAAGSGTTGVIIQSGSVADTVYVSVSAPYIMGRQPARRR